MVYMEVKRLDLFFAGLFLALSLNALHASAAFTGILNPNATSYVAVNASSELSNSISAGFNLTANPFHLNFSQNCVLFQISQCDNNIPAQFVCINNASYSYFASQKKALSNNRSYVCPDFFMQGHISCAVQNGYCVVQDSILGANIPNRSSITIPATIGNITAANVTTLHVNLTVSATTSNTIISGIGDLLGEIESFFSRFLHI